MSTARLWTGAKRSRARARVAAPAGVLLALVLVLSAPPSALAVGGLKLTVEGTNGSQGIKLTVAQLKANVDVSRDTPVTIRSANGKDVRDTRGGTSVEKALELAGIDPNHVTTLSIGRPGEAGSLTLSRDDIVNGFYGDPLPGVRWATFDAYNDTELRFFRPLRTDGAPNAGDQLDPPTNTDLVARLELDGPLLTVSAHADPTSVGKNHPVSFSVDKVEGGSGTPRLTWDFGDPSDGEQGADVVHPYEADGRYTAVVTAVTPDGGSGVAIVGVQVGDSSQSGPPPGGGAGPGTAPSGGGTGSPSAPSSGPRRGARGTDRGRRARRRAEPDQRGESRAPRGDAAPAQTTPPPPAGSETGGSSPGASTEPGRVNGDGGATTPNAHGPASPAGDARTVSGVLLASAGGGVDAGTLRELTTRTAAEQLAVRSAATADEPIGGRVLGAAGLVLLLALGAARELGTLSVRRSRPS